MQSICLRPGISVCPLDHMLNARLHRMMAIATVVDAVWAAVVGGGSRMAGALRLKLRTTRNTRALNRLSDHLLDDVGLSRGDIPALARALAATPLGLGVHQWNGTVRNAALRDLAAPAQRAGSWPTIGMSQTGSALSNAA